MPVMFSSFAQGENSLPVKPIRDIGAEFGKMKGDVKTAVQEASTVFIHYVIDRATELVQGEDKQRPVTLRPQDIQKAMEDLGFGHLLDRVVK